jgi:hypothetical protein
MKFNPEDANADSLTGNFGPNCRNCHRGASACDRCHDSSKSIITTDAAAAASNFEETYPNWVSMTAPMMGWNVTSATAYPWGWPYFGGLEPTIPAGFPASYLGDTDNPPDGFDGAAWDPAVKTFFARAASERYYNERTVSWASDWRTNASALSPTCSDDGFSWPHRTMGYMMLKDEMFGLNSNGAEVSVGATKTLNGTDVVAHDLDSVCLDCHNPNIWNASSYANHTDVWGNNLDNFDDELLLRGLP